MPRSSIPRTCVQCGKTFLTYPCYVQRGGALFCSHPCSALHRRRDEWERFWSLADKSGDCWLWLGAKSPGGYGMFRVSQPERRQVYAHRHLWEHLRGDPGELDVCHACDNPACVNPDHLFLGSRKANMRDCKAKDRHNRGERNGSAKLTADDAVEIRRLYAEGGVTQYALAARFGVAVSVINRIIHRKLWAHL